MSPQRISRCHFMLHKTNLDFVQTANKIRVFPLDT